MANLGQPAKKTINELWESYHLWKKHHEQFVYILINDNQFHVNIDISSFVGEKNTTLICPPKVSHPIPPHFVVPKATMRTTQVRIMSAMMLIIQVMVYFPNTTCRRKRGRFIFWQTPDTENTFNHHRPPGEGMFLYPAYYMFWSKAMLDFCMVNGMILFAGFHLFVGKKTLVGHYDFAHKKGRLV